MENKILEITLTQNESDLIRKKLQDITYEPLGDEKYIIEVRKAAYACLPSKILDLLEMQRTSKNPLPYFIINHLPIDQFVFGSPSFSETGKKYKSGVLSENIISALGAILGEPYSIHFEGTELVNNLTPQKNCKNHYTGLGSDVELDFHIENAALKFMPEGDYSPMGLIFLGIRNDETTRGPSTFVSDARLALKKLSEEDLEILYGRNFIIKLPFRWREALESKENTDLCPMVSGPIDFPRMSAVFYPNMVLAVNDKAKIAFENLYKAIKAVSIGIQITPGKLMYVDNRLALHSREKFEATYDEDNMPYRWIQRLFIAPNLWNLRSFSSLKGRVYIPTNRNLISALKTERVA